MENKTFLCRSANGKDIFFDAASSHTATHFKDAPTLRGLATGILHGTSLTKPIEAMAIDMGKDIGVTDVVMIDSTDEVVYAMRVAREDQGWVPFTKSRAAQPCRIVSLYLTQNGEQSYELASTWIGPLDSPPFPQMAEATDESVPYWQTHAFVWGSQGIIPDSERSDCPW